MTHRPLLLVARFVLGDPPQSPWQEEMLSEAGVHAASEIVQMCADGGFQEELEPEINPNLPAASPDPLAKECARL